MAIIACNAAYEKREIAACGPAYERGAGIPGATGMPARAGPQQPDVTLEGDPCRAYARLPPRQPSCLLTTSTPLCSKQSWHPSLAPAARSLLSVFLLVMCMATVSQAAGKAFSVLTAFLDIAARVTSAPAYRRDCRRPAAGSGPPRLSDTFCPRQRATAPSGSDMVPTHRLSLAAPKWPAGLSGAGVKSMHLEPYRNLFFWRSENACTQCVSMRRLGLL